MAIFKLFKIFMLLGFQGFKKMLNFTQANTFLICCSTLDCLKKVSFLP